MFSNTLGALLRTPQLPTQPWDAPASSTVFRPVYNFDNDMSALASAAEAFKVGVTTGAWGGEGAGPARQVGTEGTDGVQASFAHLDDVWLSEPLLY